LFRSDQGVVAGAARVVQAPAVAGMSFVEGVTMSLDRLPVLDLERWTGGADRDGFLADLRRATHEVGFFYLVGHGVPQDLVDEVLQVSREFFALPEAHKLAIENVRSPHFRGYTRIG